MFNFEPLLFINNGLFFVWAILRKMLKQAECHPQCPLTTEGVQSLLGLLPFSSFPYPTHTDHSLEMKVSSTVTSSNSNLCLWNTPCHLPRSNSNATSSGQTSWMSSLWSFSLLKSHDPWNCLCYILGTFCHWTVSSLRAGSMSDSSLDPLQD